MVLASLIDNCFYKQNEDIEENMESNKICKIRDIYRAIALLETQFEQQFNLNINELMALCTLKEKESLTSGEMAAALGLSTSNASKVICSIEKKELVERSLDKDDKRLMHFSLTENGMNKLSKIKCDEIELPHILKNIVE